MPLRTQDGARMWDMLVAARQARATVAGMTWQEYLENRTAQLAVERCIEIIGEAARFVTTDARAGSPQLPWSKIVGLRHILAHEYGRIDHQILWEILSQHVPDLIRLLEDLFAKEPPPRLPDDRAT